MVYFKNGEILFNSGAVDPTLIGSSYSSAICLFDDGNKMAVSILGNVKIYSVAFDDAGVPSLTLDYDINPALGQNCYSIAIDAAHNMYCAVDRANASSTGNVGVFALPVAENVCETPAPSAQKIVISGGTAVAGDVDGDGVVTAGDITALYNYILNGDDSAIVNGDQDGDGSITSGDITFIYNILLGNN